VRTAEQLSTLAHDADIMWNYYGSADKAHAILDVQQTAQRLPLVLMLVSATLISLLFVLCPAQSTRALVTCLACRCCDHPDMPPFERLYDPHFDVLVEEQGGSGAEADPPHGGAVRRAFSYDVLMDEQDESGAGTNERASQATYLASYHNEIARTW
jgi:hypothetical protein